jgi:glucose-1-phosphate thymidylyltransferase
MGIAKAVLLAHGHMGPGIWSQLGLRSWDLVPIANQPLLFHNLASLAAIGVRSVALLVDGRVAPEIRALAGDGAAWDLELHYIETPASLDTLDQLRAAEDVVGGEPFIAQRGDALVGSRSRTIGHDFAHGELDALALELEPDGRRPGPRLRLVEALAGSPEVVGMCFLRPEALSNLEPSVAPMGLGDLVADMRAHGGRVQHTRVEGCLPCRGDRAALLAANRQMLESMTPDFDDAELIDSEVQGAVRIGRGARLHRTLVRGPAIIGPGAQLSNAYIGPYTSIGAGAIIEASEVEHSIVLPDAEVRCIDVRLESSVVGRGARVVRELRVPRSLQLLVADGAEVTLA